MALNLPDDRNTTYVPKATDTAGSQVKSEDLNDIQDHIVAMKTGEYQVDDPGPGDRWDEGDPFVFDKLEVLGDAEVGGNAHVVGDLDIDGGFEVGGDLAVTGAVTAATVATLGTGIRHASQLRQVPLPVIGGTVGNFTHVGSFTGQGYIRADVQDTISLTLPVGAGERLLHVYVICYDNVNGKEVQAKVYRRKKNLISGTPPGTVTQLGATVGSGSALTDLKFVLLDIDCDTEDVFTGGGGDWTDYRVVIQLDADNDIRLYDVYCTVDHIA